MCVCSLFNLCVFEDFFCAFLLGGVFSRRFILSVLCDVLLVKSYGKFNQTKVHIVPFMVHISSTPVVKYLVVIRAYLFKW